jgi:NTE family protein
MYIEQIFKTDVFLSDNNYPIMKNATPLFKRPVVNSPGMFFIFFLLFSLTFNHSYSQGAPKIGLVLSGGGAKGLAHIGVLKALEEAGITPDFITGTSMGSIMGGLYAVGYSADEIKQIALDADWDQLLTNKLPLNEVVYVEKDYYNRYLTEIHINGFRPEMPKGLIEGQKLSMLLSNLTAHVSDIRDFSKLPIPYACIASDIENGDRVVLNSGSLARSMRASMAIPTVFTPVLMNDRLLVDGGLVHNFPVDENLEMGADYIIGVFVGNTLMKKEEMGSPLSVLTQSAFIMGSYDTEKQKSLVDLYIEPDISDFSAGDFHRASEIIEVGEKYGQMFMEEFKALNDSMTALGRKNKKIVKPAGGDSIHITNINIIGNDFVPSSFIIDRLGIEDNSNISIQKLEEGIAELSGSEYFTQILYDFKPFEEGEELELMVTEAPEGKLRFGLQYDRETGPALLLHLTYRNLLLNNSRVLVESEISENMIFDANYLKYFGDGQRFGLTGGYLWRNSEVPNVEDGNVSGLLEYNFNKYYAGLNSSHRMNRILEIIYSYKTAGLKPKVVGEEYRYIDRIKYSSHNIEARFEYNDLDDLYFPKSGDKYGVYLKYTPRSKSKITIELADTIDAFDFEYENNDLLAPKIYHKMVRSFGDKITLGLQNAYYFNLLPDRDTISYGVGFLNENYIGGFRQLAPNIIPFWGARPLQYYSENLFFNELMFQYEFKRNFYFQFVTQYFHAYYPLGFLFEDLKDRPYDFGGKPFLLGIGGSLSYDSPIGPITFAAGKANNDTPLQYWINIGFYFDRD